MFDTEDAGFNLVGGRIVTPQGILDGTVAVEGGHIVAVSAGQRAGGSGLDMCRLPDPRHRRLAHRSYRTPCLSALRCDVELSERADGP
jgi:hypothetical protein